jgi:hypothetical protein
LISSTVFRIVNYTIITVPTETHVVTSYLLEGTPDTWPALPAIGKPIQQSEIYLLDENGNFVKMVKRANSLPLVFASQMVI